MTGVLPVLPNLGIKWLTLDDRWFDAYDGVRDCGVPLIVVDSGWRWSCCWRSGGSTSSWR
mgnify:CR=1 FL=1